MSQSGPSIAGEPQVSALERVIAGQPEVISRAITANFESIRAAAVQIAGARRVRICGVGMSAEAARVGEHLLRSVGVDARAANAYDLATYPPNFDPGDLVVVIAHREGRAFASRVVLRAVQAGLSTVALVGEGGSISSAGVTVETVPQDGAATSTTAFTAGVAALAAACARFEPRSPLASAVPAYREMARAMLASREVAIEVARLIAQGSRALIVGAGVSYPVARAGALAMKETCYQPVEGLHLEDALQGGLLSLNPGDVLIQIAPEGASDDRQTDLARVAKMVGFERWKIGGREDGSRWHSPLPDVAEIATPILSMIPLQWLALESAIAFGINPDAARSDDPRYDDAFSTVAR
jgi:glucosamine--fructose-6-phosphate aminotransferase (isomerizing)